MSPSELAGKTGGKVLTRTLGSHTFGVGADQGGKVGDHGQCRVVLQVRQLQRPHQGVQAFSTKPRDRNILHMLTMSNIKH